MKVLCEECKKKTNHKILKEEIYNESDQENYWWEEHRYRIIQCQGCETISFQKLYNDISQESYALNIDEDPWTETLYPKRSIGTLAIKSLINTPQIITEIYRETIDAYNNNQLILCSGGLRAIIEGVCKDLCIEKGEVQAADGKKKVSKNLDGKIEGLATKGFLTKGNSQFLHQLRFLGNSALHELSSPSKENLRIAIEIIELTLDNIYEIQHKAASLKAAIAKQKSNSN